MKCTNEFWALEFHIANSALLIHFSNFRTMYAISLYAGIYLEYSWKCESFIRWKIWQYFSFGNKLSKIWFLKCSYPSVHFSKVVKFFSFAVVFGNCMNLLHIYFNAYNRTPREYSSQTISCKCVFISTINESFSC